MLPRDKTQQIQIRVSEKFRKDTEAIADSLNLTLSDYIRIAVEKYNKQYQQKETELYPKDTHTKYWDKINNRPMNPVDNENNYAESVKAKKEYREEKQGKMCKPLTKDGGKK